MHYQITDKILIGNSDSATYDTFDTGVSGLLNVANDLEGKWGWLTSVEYMQVGLIDGPGNPCFAYCGAILALKTLVSRHDKTLVYCHEGTRSLSVAIMYLMIDRGRNSPHPTFFNYWETWDKIYKELKENHPGLPEPNEYHKGAADKLPLGALEQITWIE